jgi:dTDP-4-amino-4,6-dideoxygalactose transaminase
VHHLFVVRCTNRDQLRAHLSSNDIESVAHYPTGAHQQRATPGLRLDPAGVGVTEHHARTCLSIPCHHALTDHDIERVIGAVNSFPTPATR